MLGAAVFGILSALGVEYLSVRQKIREDSAIGILWAFGMAIGIIFIYMTPGYTPNLMSYLFGSILTVSNADIIALGIMSVILILYFGIFYRTILYISFDEVFARTYSSYVDVFKYITTSLNCPYNSIEYKDGRCCTGNFAADYSAKYCNVIHQGLF